MTNSTQVAPNADNFKMAQSLVDNFEGEDLVFQIAKAMKNKEKRNPMIKEDPFHVYEMGAKRLVKNMELYSREELIGRIAKQI